MGGEIAQAPTVRQERAWRGMTKERAILIIGQTVLGIGLLIAWMAIVDLNAVRATISQVSWPLVMLAAVLATGSTLVRSIRWRSILKTIVPLPLIEVWLITLASTLINFVIPIRSGEVARALFLKQRHRSPISATLPTIAVDRSLDLLSVLALGALGALTGLSLGHGMSGILLLGAAILLGFVGSVVLAIVLRDRLIHWFDRLLPRIISSEPRKRILGMAQGFIAGFGAIGRHPRAIGRLIVLSFLASFLDAGVFFTLFTGLGLALSPMLVATGYAFFALTFLIPSAPGYLGSMEAFGSLVFNALGVEETMAASGVVLFHALNGITLAATGGLAIWVLGLRPASAIRSVFRTSELDPEAPLNGLHYRSAE